MDAEAFVEQVFLRFPPDDISDYYTYGDKVQDYVKALKTGENYRYEKVLEDVIQKHPYKTAPTSNFLWECQKPHVIHKPRRYPKFLNIYAEKNGEIRVYSYNPDIEGEKERVIESLRSQGYLNFYDTPKQEPIKDKEIALLAEKFRNNLKNMDFSRRKRGY